MRRRDAMWLCSPSLTERSGLSCRRSLAPSRHSSPRRNPASHPRVPHLALAARTSLSSAATPWLAPITLCTRTASNGSSGAERPASAHRTRPPRPSIGSDRRALSRALLSSACRRPDPSPASLLSSHHPSRHLAHSPAPHTLELPDWVQVCLASDAPAATL
ncbi:hypothetical protein FB451DRAFT_1240190 [Mycena latifolia]|nr:hypothetical protein FB451DRAFT_1240190 [Mycena latifolia]